MLLRSLHSVTCDKIFTLLLCESENVQLIMIQNNKKRNYEIKSMLVFGERRNRVTRGKPCRPKLKMSSRIEHEIHGRQLTTAMMLLSNGWSGIGGKNPRE